MEEHYELLKKKDINKFLSFFIGKENIDEYKYQEIFKKYLEINHIITFYDFETDEDIYFKPSQDGDWRMIFNAFNGPYFEKIKKIKENKKMKNFGWFVFIVCIVAILSMVSHLLITRIYNNGFEKGYTEAVKDFYEGKLKMERIEKTIVEYKRIKK